MSKTREDCFWWATDGDVVATGGDTANPVWATNSTSVRMRQGLVYLMAVMDWFSRYVLCRRVSLEVEADFYVEVLSEAL